MVDVHVSRIHRRHVPEVGGIVRSMLKDVGYDHRDFLITNLLCIPLSNLIMVLSIIILPFHAAGICPQFIIDADGLLLSALTDILGIISTM